MTVMVERRSDNRESFPRHLLDGCESALVLFAAAFDGAQDAVWILDAGLRGTCVDIDGEALARMAGLYPDDWTFVNGDVFAFAESAAGRWDVVTVDCPSGAFGRCAGLVGLWCSLARRVVVLGSGARTMVSAPDGWLVTDRRRRSSYDGGVYWTVLERTLDE